MAKPEQLNALQLAEVVEGLPDCQVDAPESLVTLAERAAKELREPPTPRQLAALAGFGVRVATKVQKNLAGKLARRRAERN